MYLFESLYPFVLAGLNVATGWVLYDVLESVLGFALLGVGLLITLSLFGGLINERRFADGSTA